MKRVTHRTCKPGLCPSGFAARATILFAASRLICALLAVGSQAAPKQKSPYMAQDYVDTTIMREFYNLSEAASMAGVGFRQKESIEAAKRTARRLRSMAKGDPNEKYVLWKINELEAQIYLEERDLVLQQVNQGMIGANQLVAQFNGEVGKPRPDFASLKRIHAQTTQLDPGKANSMASSFNKRYRAISREAIFSIEKALLAGDLDKSSDELAYCIRNRSFLTIAESKLQQLQTRVDGLARARYEKPSIDADLYAAAEFLKQKQLGNMRTSIQSAVNRFAPVKCYLPHGEAGAMQAGIDRVQRKMDLFEDSLVQVNLAILQSRGVTAANEYMQNTLRQYGVSVDKVAHVDRMILSVASPDDGRMRQEIGSVADEAGSDGRLFIDDMRMAAKKKAQQKADSIRRIEEERVRIALREQARRDSIENAAREEEQRRFRIHQENATTLSAEIYTLLEKDKARNATSLFQKQRDYLRRYLRHDEFSMLETTVGQLSEARRQPSGRELSYVSVSAAPGRSTAAPAAGNSAEQEKLRKNREKAQEVILQIYGMLERNEIASAYTRFQKVRVPLQKYLDKDAFAMLESTVTQAYSSASSGQ